jgi:hypothetical protein
MLATTQPAFGCYLSRPGQAAQPTGIIVLTLAHDRVAAITRFLGEGLPRVFGPPGEPG